MKISYLGKLTFTHEVFEKYIKKDSISYSLIECKSLSEIADSVRENYADLGILPLTNRIIGKINSYNLDGIEIIEKIKMPIRMSIGGIGKKHEIKCLISKKEAFSQCSRYIKENKLKIIEDNSTVSGIEKILKYKLLDTAVICPYNALKAKNLKVYENDISNIKPNWTIFGLICANRELNPTHKLFLRTGGDLSGGKAPYGGKLVSYR